MKEKEFINKVIRNINKNAHLLIFKCTTIIERCYIYCIGVKSAHNVCFRGWSHFYRASNSVISLGANCVFNSSSYQNHLALKHSCIISTYSNNASIQIGNGVGMSAVSINCWSSIKIGDNTRIGANCIIMDSDFHLDDYRINGPSPITIGKNVWLGANVTVMKGVSIGENTIIGINSVVTKDIPANCIAAGSPCRVVKMI